MKDYDTGEGVDALTSIWAANVAFQEQYPGLNISIDFTNDTMRVRARIGNALVVRVLSPSALITAHNPMAFYVKAMRDDVQDVSIRAKALAA